MKQDRRTLAAARRPPRSLVVAACGSGTADERR